MVAWALSVTGAVLLGVLADVVMAEGETKKFLRGITAVAVLFVIVAPLPNLLKGTFSPPEVGDAPTVSEDYMSNLFARRYERLERQAEEMLAQMGLSGAEVQVSFSLDSDTFATEIYEVVVDLRKASITEEGKNIDNSVIAERVGSCVGVAVERVRVVR